VNVENFTAHNERFCRSYAYSVFYISKIRPQTECVTLRHDASDVSITSKTLPLPTFYFQICPLTQPQDKRDGQKMHRRYAPNHIFKNVIICIQWRTSKLSEGGQSFFTIVWRHKSTLGEVPKARPF